MWITGSSAELLPNILKLNQEFTTITFRRELALIYEKNKNRIPNMRSADFLNS